MDFSGRWWRCLWAALRLYWELNDFIFRSAVGATPGPTHGAPAALASSHWANKSNSFFSERVSLFRSCFSYSSSSSSDLRKPV